MRRLLFSFIGMVCGPAVLAAQAPSPVTAIRAGRLLDSEAGRILANQVILIVGTKIRHGPQL